MPIRPDDRMRVNCRLTQVGVKFKTSHKPTRYSAVFLCECGARKVLLIDNARKSTHSCGCFQHEQLLKQNLTHGHTTGKSGDRRSKTYVAWQSMLQRVRAKGGTKTHRNYGARGIGVCDRWLRFENFLEDMGERPEALNTVDRIKNNKGYGPGNCRWATMTTQNRNTRSNVFVEYKGRSMLFIEACETVGMNYEVVRQRLLRGWLIKDALETPIYGKRHAK